MHQGGVDASSEGLAKAEASERANQLFGSLTTDIEMRILILAEWVLVVVLDRSVCQQLQAPLLVCSLVLMRMEPTPRHRIGNCYVEC